MPRSRDWYSARLNRSRTSAQAAKPRLPPRHPTRRQAMRNRASSGGGLPMRAQFFVELGPTLFREENPRAFELHALAGAGYRIGQPPRPAGREEHVVGAPGDQGRRLQALELVLDGEGVRVVERGQET